ncbi:MAG: SlyX protein [Legionellales bacterium]|nr:SlyX protein [Legionellales bacterium]HCU89617.1 SlyX protein [Gammaproteobacteria bacterium]|tara:strand:- start:1269 stop:1478 length:210 start_codon:yes stop_codon:yes gene_type:complete
MLEEDRIISIESKIAFHEDLVQTLNNTVYNQQKRISDLENQLQTLLQRIVNLDQPSNNPTEHPEQPPHY